jgi:hypothetical protein
MNLPFLLLGCIFLIMVLRYAYMLCFQKEKYIQRTRKFRCKYREKSVILNLGVILFGFYNRHPDFEILAVRFASIIMILVAIIIIVAIRGPFIID